nr:hypothetical protein [Tanacetum cinerariifolium]
MPVAVARWWCDVDAGGDVVMKMGMMLTVVVPWWSWWQLRRDSRGRWWCSVMMVMVWIWWEMTRWGRLRWMRMVWIWWWLVGVAARWPEVARAAPEIEDRRWG